MRVPRIYHPSALKPAMIAELTVAASQHISRVLRLQTGAELILFNGEGGEFKAVIHALRKQNVVVEVKDYVAREIESSLRIHLGQAISRGDKMDFTIQKAVELGVTAITPLFTERCGVKINQDRWEKRWQHWQAVAVAACEQSGRNRLPVIHQPSELTDWVTQVKFSKCCIILHPDKEKRTQNFPKHCDEVALLVGSEGGFSDEEVKIAQRENFYGLCLGPRILRTETAALTAIAVLQAKWGDFDFERTLF